MPATYEPIATTTLGSAAATISFTSISASYTDIRVVLAGSHETTATTLRMQVNSDTGTNYSYTELIGDGATASSSRGTSSSRINCGNANFNNTQPSLITVDWFSYAGSTNKTCLVTASQDRNGSGSVLRTVGLWRSTSAITSVQLFPATGNFATGTTATLYGILKA
jgi:hypothetical protein